MYLELVKIYYLDKKLQADVQKRVKINDYKKIEYSVI